MVVRKKRNIEQSAYCDIPLSRSQCPQAKLTGENAKVSTCVDGSELVADGSDAEVGAMLIDQLLGDPSDALRQCLGHMLSLLPPDVAASRAGDKDSVADPRPLSLPLALSHVHQQRLR